MLHQGDGSGHPEGIVVHCRLYRLHCRQYDPGQAVDWLVGHYGISGCLGHHLRNEDASHQACEFVVNVMCHIAMSFGLERVVFIQ